MRLPNEQLPQKLQFYVTDGYPCGYLPNKLAQSLIAMPQHLVDANVYSGLIHKGFRRSGNLTYRPHCEHCQACIPVRLIVDAFKLSRSQKRAFKQHKNLVATIHPVTFKEEYFKLYNTYQQARHPDETKPEQENLDKAEQYKNLLCQTNVESVMVAFKQDETLKMVSVIDIVQDGISAVYTFYDPSDAKDSYGTYNVIWQAMWAKTLGLPYLYLGYWVQDSKKMAYKQNYQPLEKLIAGQWR